MRGFRGVVQSRYAKCPTSISAERTVCQLSQVMRKMTSRIMPRRQPPRSADKSPERREMEAAGIEPAQRSRRGQSAQTHTMSKKLRCYLGFHRLQQLQADGGGTYKKCAECVKFSDIPQQPFPSGVN
jgi:hypothetical protein